jgi:hypothetical protein
VRCAIRRRPFLAGIFMAAVLFGLHERATANQPAPALGKNGLAFWTLQSFPDGPHDPQAIFEFDGTLLWLRTPCSQDYWVYQYDLGVLQIKNPHAAARDCGGDRSAIFKAYDAAIQKVRVPRLDGEMLSLLDREGRTMLILKRLAAAGLENRRWHISAYYDGNELVADNDMLRYSHIRFVYGDLRGSMFNGSPGCGTVLGSYTTDGRRLAVTAGTFARGRCPDTALNLTHKVAQALSGARSFDRDGERYLLRDSEGRTQVVLTPSD